MKYFVSLLAAGPDLEEAISPVYQIINAVLPILLALVFAAGSIVCIKLGVQFTKSDESGKREKAKQDLIWAIVGFGLIFVLIVILNLIKEPMYQWISDLTGTNYK